MTDALLDSPAGAPAQAADAAAIAGADEFGDPSARLQAAFATIARTRMDGVPILNPALEVECVGFRRWNGFWLGVLVTPWCMNLMLLPAVSALWPRKRIGEKLKYVFPAGVFEFIAGREALLAVRAPALPGGPAPELFESYLMCSLFSPVFEFADHAGAVATAAACLDALFDEANYEATEMAVTRAPASISADAAAAAAAAEQAERDASAEHEVNAEDRSEARSEAEREADAEVEAVAAEVVPARSAAPVAPTELAVSKRNFLRGRWSNR